eukprot:m.28799 g.28799  ORF g.28799 m.28799 type:complete len:73 (+) comp13647_c0_seq1:95-313(+)
MRIMQYSMHIGGSQHTAPVCWVHHRETQSLALCRTGRTKQHTAHGAQKSAIRSSQHEHGQVSKISVCGVMLL